MSVFEVKIDGPSEKKKKQRLKTAAMKTKEHSKRNTISRRVSGLCTYVQLWKAGTTLSISTEDA